jgi:hypothetical protein
MVSVTKNVEAGFERAGREMNGVNGNGGGIRSRTARPTAPTLPTLRRIRVSRFGGMCVRLVRADLDPHPEGQRCAATGRGRQDRDHPCPRVAAGCQHQDRRRCHPYRHEQRESSAASTTTLTARRPAPRPR